jgi:ribosomal protein L22
MADEKDTAKKPAAPRARAAAKKPAEAAAAKAPAKPARSGAGKDAADAAAKPAARTRAAAKKTDAAGETTAKPARARAAAGKAAAPAKAVGGEPARAKAVEAEVAVAASSEVAKPARTRAAMEPAQPAEAPRARTHKQQVRSVASVRAQAKYVRSSARKARLVCNHIRGKSVPEARAFLAFAPRGVARDWAKLLDSAVANAEHNHELLGDDLHIKEAYADEGPTLKRFRTRAMGRATPIHKRTSHLTITLGPKE